MGRNAPLFLWVLSSDMRRLFVFLETFQLGCPFRLVCIGMIPAGTRAVELSLHERFAAYRLHGEWFEDSPELQSYISVNAKIGSI